MAVYFVMEQFVGNELGGNRVIPAADGVHRVVELSAAEAVDGATTEWSRLPWQ
jgi:hypothetical protein